MTRPNWYPNHLKSCMSALSLLEKIPNEGIFFIKYPERLAEEISGLLNGFFTTKGGKYVSYNDEDFSFKGTIEDDFKLFIEQQNFCTF